MRVLVVRLDGIGDALVTTPLLDALAAAGHAVGIALSDRNADVFARERFIGTHVLERIPWPRHGATPATRRAAEADIAACRYDVALVASEEPDAYTLTAAIPERVGFTTGWTKPLKSLWVRQRVTRTVRRAGTVRGAHAHEAEILFALGAGYASGRPTSDAERLRGWLLDAAPVPARSGIVVQLSAKWRTSGIDDETFGVMAERLRVRGARFIAAPAERAPLAARFPQLAIEAPRDVRAWLGVLDAAAAVVTVDTGAAHAAGMLGVPVVDVFPDRDADVQMRRWRPWASSNIVLRASELRRAPTTLVTQALDAL